MVWKLRRIPLSHEDAADAAGPLTWRDGAALMVFASPVLAVMMTLGVVAASHQFLSVHLGRTATVTALFGNAILAILGSSIGYLMARGWPIGRARIRGAVRAGLLAFVGYWAILALIGYVVETFTGR